MEQENTMEDLKIELAHVGINAENEEEALKTANLLCSIFGLKLKNGNSSAFAGTAVEVMKKPFLGKNGHIGFSTANIEKAVALVETNGFPVNMETTKYGPDGKMTAVYLKNEVAGFALHFVQKK